MEVAGKPGWWAFLLLVPGVSIVVGIMAMLELAKRFDKDKVFAVLLIIMPYIFLPVLGFGSAKYKQQPLAA